ncbi:MAG: hypothetical protein IPJ65_16120 [Archangiaceae bacterium]|nr:hypothetical protein [Archangiaceae bacterium]
MQRRTMRWSALAVGALAAACGTPTPTPNPEVTYYRDVAPLVSQKCLGCHQAGGVAPLQLETYAQLKTNAASVAAQVSSKRMPPYLVTHDGTCGNFEAQETLSDAQIATLTRWAESEMVEGDLTHIDKPSITHLDGATTEVKTPNLVPVAQGGQLAELDEYRCYVAEVPAGQAGYLTGYEVTPGNAALVHHVLGFVIDPAKQVTGGHTNAEVMAALDAQDPDRTGWPCYGLAGDGVAVESVPISWAPGQGPVSYPTGVGAALKATDKLVLQVHYNLADPSVRGQSDQTAVKLRVAPTVQRKVAFLFYDPLLNSLFSQQPTVIAPHDPHAKLSWDSTLGAEFPYLSPLPYVDLIGVLPHMHGRGVKQQLSVGDANNTLACAADVQRWDFGWQKVYFYSGTPTRLTKDSRIGISCEWDTSHDEQAVLPGWGTRNEMCLTVMMVALPEGI